MAKKKETRDPYGPPDGADRLMRAAFIMAPAFAACWVTVRYADQSEVPLFVALAWTAGLGYRLFRNGLTVPAAECPRLVAQPFATTCAALFLTQAISPPGTERYPFLRETLIPLTLWACLVAWAVGAVWWQGSVVLRDLRRA